MIIQTTEEDANKIAELIFNTKILGVNRIDGSFLIKIDDSDIFQKYKSYIKFEYVNTLENHFNIQTNNNIFKFKEHDNNIFNILREEKLKRILQK